MVFNKCCCCVDLRSGCIIIGILQIFGGLGNFRFLDWITIITGIVNIASGACLLFGSIKYNQIGILINLICTAVATVLGFVVAILFFIGASASINEESDDFLIDIIVGGIFLAAVVVEIYLWLCIFSFYLKLKSRSIATPGTGVYQPNSVDQPANQLQPNTGGSKYINVTPGP